MSPPDVERLLAEAAPAGPRGALREQVLEAVGEVLRQPVPAIDRWLARPLPWTVGAVLLAALLAGTRAQAAREERGRAERVDVASTRRAAEQAAGALSTFLRDARVAAWARARFLAQAWVEQIDRRDRGLLPGLPWEGDVR